MKSSTPRRNSNSTDMDRAGSEVEGEARGAITEVAAVIEDEVGEVVVEAAGGGGVDEDEEVRLRK
jgi:hypothetical protein